MVDTEIRKKTIAIKIYYVHYSITQTRRGMEIQTAIKQLTKTKFLRKDRVILAKKYVVRFFALGIYLILKSYRILFVVKLSPPILLKKPDHADGVCIIEMTFFQSVPKC